MHVGKGSTGFWHIKQGFWRKNQGSDGKTGKRETTQKMRRRYENIESKTVASYLITQGGLQKTETTKQGEG